MALNPRRFSGINLGFSRAGLSRVRHPQRCLDALVGCSAGLMRYRSRRDLMEIASAPEFNGPHEFKLASMKKTIAFPIEPNLLIGDLRGLVGLLLFSLAAMSHLAFGERGSAASRIAD